MKKLIATLAAVALAAMMSSCASTPQEKSANKLLEMQAVKTKYLKDKIPAGMGIGISKDEQIAMEKADQNARVDLARELDVRMKALTKNFKEDVGGDVAEHFQSASKAIIDTRMSGATLTDVQVETTEDGQFKVYGVMTLDSDLVTEYIKMLEEQEKKDEAEKVRAAAEKAYAELDEIED